MEANNHNNVIAPFIMKTYQMVNDPTTNGFISWGRANNSFIIVKPLDFSQRILPAYFKHSNFSSFVRQLNTYGFRKVDPDRWEFANEWFLRGQTHLLRNILRRKLSKNSSSNAYGLLRKQEEDDAEEEILMGEIARLKQEQKALDLELLGMNKRLEATEKRPQQMMAFLCKVVQDPEILPRMMLEKERNKKLVGDKKRCLAISTTTVKHAQGEEEVGGNLGPIWPPSEANLDVEMLYQSSYSPETPTTNYLSQRQVMGTQQFYSYCGPAATSSSWWSGSSGGSGCLALSPPSKEDRVSRDVSYVAAVDASPPPYPFSLLGGGF